MPYANEVAQTLAERAGQRRSRAKSRGLTDPTTLGLTLLQAEILRNPVALFTSEEKRKRLNEVIQAGICTPKTVTPDHVLRAIAEDNKMAGDYAPEKHLVAAEIRWHFVVDAPVDDVHKLGEANAQGPG